MLYIEPKRLSCCFLVSLHDINMRKAFKSCTVQDQQVLSKGSTPNSVAEMRNSSDRPPPLSTLTAYRYCTHCKKKQQHLNRLHFQAVSHFTWIFVFLKYREDSTDAMKFYSDPSYFFDLWKEKMLQDTEDKRKERRRQRVRAYSYLHCYLTTLFLCICLASGFASSFLSTRVPLPGTEAKRRKQHPSARGEKGEKGSKPQARVEQDGIR